jgi:hypothetical protein
MVARVCKKCRFYEKYLGKCGLTGARLEPWNDACASYDLKQELDYKISAVIVTGAPP